jgi:CheY-like chemotaxis protein
LHLQAAVISELMTVWERCQKIKFSVDLTGYATSNDGRTILEAGFRRHLTKPFDRQDLLATVVDVMASSQALSEDK